ncbi:type II toxin-antitoxin system HicB family antitoxin [Jiella sp. MQZ9-1]|uniref:Type II toxin-antitoxin system HicB family antitoxin n=1 Tax=Jiella flava TaxID=2816857 RepID=A0A939JTE6_9HYPH|nr:type II toxin-antitoxin system HicB family antitoxin [Jiella flava]MBO0662045.1 type II toxin-antitoxin system HicB family antitoxin [Jiella flava]MCD2470628.1 type II toxin-antitoxin system HicB family antitoxin [Jiella flava]
MTITLQPEPEVGFTVLVPALPEVVTSGATIDEAMAHAREAIEGVLALYKEQGRDISADAETQIAHLTVAA